MTASKRARKQRGADAPQCPLCHWPLHPTQDGSARYGGPDADDEESVSEEPYLHALANVVRLGSVEKVPLCADHRRQLGEIVTRDATGQHPKKDRKLVAAERRVRSAREEFEASTSNLDRKQRERRRA